MLWLIIPALILLFLIVILFRTAGFRPAIDGQPLMEAADVNGQRAIEHLAEMIRCRTVSYYQEELIDKAEFQKFRELLQRLYPRVNGTCTCEYIGGTGILYRLSGENDLNPSVFMAHYDVVPANEQTWEKPAFDGIIDNGVLWGRGTLDTKCTLCGVLESAETLLEQGFKPKNDIYFAFSGDEEISGESAPKIVDELERRGIKPVLVIDEGGAVVENVFPGVKQPCALIGIGEKGMLDVEFKLEGKGGHASSPPPHTPVGVLAKAVIAVENHPFKYQLTKPAKEMFDTLGRHSSFLYRLIFANLWCFLPLLDILCRKTGGELNALMRTTCAFTMMEGSKAINVIPPTARLGANLRLAGVDTVDRAVAYLKSVIRNDKIAVNTIYGMNASIISETRGEGWDKLKRAISRTWPDALVSPYLMIAASDSRHYGRISNYVYRFSAMALTGEERGMIHGNNERIPLDKIVTTVQFYIRLMRSC
jgi:carboxypeptidase PM20D1